MTRRRRLARRLFALPAAALLVVAGFVVAAALNGFPLLEPPVASPSPTLSSPLPNSPMGIDFAGNPDCSACHLTGSGTVGTKPIPALGHALDGWRDCTACHANDRLVKTAPGHTGLHKADCLLCHKPAAPGASAAARPHHVYEGKTCLSCHGKEAPLPSAMAGRNNCWICHAGTEFADLFGEPASPSLPPLPTPKP